MYAVEWRYSLDLYCYVLTIKNHKKALTDSSVRAFLVSDFSMPYTTMALS
jgi:hypothetical protein